MAHEYEQADLDVLQSHGLVDTYEFELGVTEKGVNLLEQFSEPAGRIAATLQGFGAPARGNVASQIPVDAKVAGNVAQAHAAAFSGRIETSTTLDPIVIRWWEGVPAELPSPPPDAYATLTHMRDELAGILQGRDYRWADEKYALEVALRGIGTAIEAIDKGEAGQERGLRDGLVAAYAMVKEAALWFQIAVQGHPVLAAIIEPAMRTIGAMLGV
jgi:hypothetical protein